MSDPKIGHRVHEAHTPAPAKKAAEAPAHKSPAAEAGHASSPKEKVALSHPEAASGKDHSAHIDAIKGNFDFGSDHDAAKGEHAAKPGEAAAKGDKAVPEGKEGDKVKDGDKAKEGDKAKDGDKAKEGDKAKDGEKTPEQKKAAINDQIKDIQRELKETTDPEKKKALEEELARLQGQLKDLEPRDPGKTPDGATDPAAPAGEAGGAGGAGGAAPAGGAGAANGGGGANHAPSPWQSEQAQNAGGPEAAGPTSGPAPDSNPPGNVKEWVAQAMQILQQEGVDMSKVRQEDIYKMIEKESGGNPRAQNNWDSNAKKGTPSKGIMQCIDSTFNQYKSPGHGDIWNPVDNIVAAVKYAVSRYGSTANVPGIKSMGQGGAYKGY